MRYRILLSCITRFALVATLSAQTQVVGSRTGALAP